MAKKATDIEIKTDNIYCPSCGAIQKRTENFCAKCGENLHKKPEDVVKNEEPPKMKAKKPFYKNKVFLFFSGIFLLAVFALTGVIYLKIVEGNKFKSKVKGVWQDVQKETNVLTENISNMSNMDSFKPVALKIKEIETLIDNKLIDLEKIQTPDMYRDGKEAFVLSLSDYKNYLQDLRTAADDPSKMTNQDIEEIEASAEKSKNAFSKLLTKYDFLEKKFPENIFGVIDKFQEVRANYEEKLAEEEQSKAEEEREEKEALENKARVESIITSFMNAYIAGNETELKKHMTSAFQKEFNYADLSSDARMYSYPESFRITITKKISDNQYDVYGRELQVNRESGSKWTINRHFAVIWVQSENKWLVDRWNISTE